MRGASRLRAEVRGDGGRQKGRRPPWPLSQGLECLAEELDLYLGSQPVFTLPKKPGRDALVFSWSLRQFRFSGFPVSLVLLPDFLGREDFMVPPPPAPTPLALIHNPWRSLVGLMKVFEQEGDSIWLWSGC